MSLLEAQGWAAAAWSCIATQDNKRSQQDCWNKLGSSWLHNCGFLTEPPVVMNQMNPTIFVGNPHIFSSVKLEDFFGIPPVFLSTTFDLFLIKPWTCYRENAGSIYIYIIHYIYIFTHYIYIIWYHIYILYLYSIGISWIMKIWWSLFPDRSLRLEQACISAQRAVAAVHRDAERGSELSDEHPSGRRKKDATSGRFGSGLLPFKNHGF